MKKTTVKIPAKLNLSFEVTGTEGKFHQIYSLVASCSVYDVVTLRARKDCFVTLKEEGLKANCAVTENNAYKAAKAFINAFGTNGVDITVNKNIPVGGGMGGSSADIAAVLLGMQALYGKDYNVYPLAERLGSDVTYMLNGGYAVISGKGDIVKKLSSATRLNIVAVFGESSVSAGQVYSAFDKLAPQKGGFTDACADYLVRGDIERLAKTAENHLYAPSLGFCPRMTQTIKSLEKSGAYKGLMTGSGSTVFGIFADKTAAKKAAKQLKKEYGGRVKYVVTL